MTDPQIDPAGETGQQGGYNPPASSGQQMPGAGSPGQGVPGQASPGQGEGQGSESQGSPGRAGSAMPGASSVGTATRTTQTTGTGVPAQPGEPAAGRARAGREPTSGYGYGADTESGDIVVDSTLAKAAKLSWGALLLGGLGMIAGCAGLFVLARRSDPAPGPALGAIPEQAPDETPEAADYGLLLGLGLLAATGLLTLLLRATPAYGLVLIAHLATIVVCFCIAPYTRFAHAVYRVLAIVADNIETARAG